MAFLKFLLVILIVYLLGTLFFRVVIPWLLKRWVKKAAQRMNPNFNQENQKPKQGEVSIDYIPEDNNRDDEDDVDNGEYVDYEEIK